MKVKSIKNFRDNVMVTFAEIILHFCVFLRMLT